MPEKPIRTGNIARIKTEFFRRPQLYIILISLQKIGSITLQRTRIFLYTNSIGLEKFEVKTVSVLEIKNERGVAMSKAKRV